MKITPGFAGNWALAALLGLVCLRASVQGQVPAFQKQTGIEVGKPAVVSSATAASGHWAETEPFDPMSYGKVRGFSPVTSADPKIVLYTLSLDKNFFRVATAVDAYLDALPADNKTRDWSLVQVMDAKGAQYGGYSVQELTQRLEAIRKLAALNKIKHLSFLVSAPNAASLPKQLGMADVNNLLVAHLTGSEKPYGHAVVKWVDQFATASLSAKSIQTIVAALQKSVAANP